MKMDTIISQFLMILILFFLFLPTPPFSPFFMIFTGYR